MKNFLKLFQEAFEEALRNPIPLIIIIAMIGFWGQTKKQRRMNK